MVPVVYVSFLFHYDAKFSIEYFLQLSLVRSGMNGMFTLSYTNAPVDTIQTIRLHGIHICHLFNLPVVVWIISLTSFIRNPYSEKKILLRHGGS